MKILLVSWYFPPSNRIGAVRIGRLASYLLDRGHDIKIVTCQDPPYNQTLPHDFPQERVTRAKWVDVNALPVALAQRLKRSPKSDIRSENPSEATIPTSQRGSTQPSRFRHLKSFLSSAYTHVINWPDQRIGWLPYALGAGRRVLKDWSPDLVFASAPPFTTLLAGALLSRSARAPLVLEFRDRWWDDPYYPPPAWLRALNRFVERRLASSAAGLSTVSEPWAETYRARYGKPTIVIYNGYDSEILAKLEERPETPASDAEPHLRIVYTGGIYPGRRDPSLLFQAIGRLGEAGQAIEVAFYGTAPELVLPLAEQAGVRDNVTLHPEVSHKEAIARQSEADVLLLMQWSDPREQGNVPGKFFEYMGSRRPILILGLRDGVPATIAKETGAGVYGADAEQIAGLLTQWLALKRERGYLPAAPSSAHDGYSREEQYRKLEQFFETLQAGRSDQESRSLNS